MNNSRAFHLGISVALVISMFPATSALAVNDRAIEASTGRVIEYWTPARMQQAIPRDFVIDAKGHGYLRKPDGSLKPYGHNITAHRLSSDSPTPTAKPTSPGGGNGGGKGGGGNGDGGGSSADTTAPAITVMDPVQGAVIGASHTFSARVTDASGVKSVSFVIYYPNGVNNQKFTPSKGADDIWSITINGFTDSDDWRWSVVAKDYGPKGGNSDATDRIAFSVNTGSAGGDTITNDPWTGGGAVQTAAGRIYFEMPSGPGWGGFVCSGTVVTDGTSGRSIILTAAHCVYDDANKVFARNVMFIPNQAETIGTGTDLQCGNDPLGCWVPGFGAVDIEWTRRTFPNNIKWDYAYYVVNDTGAHQGTSTTTESLESEAGALPLSFLTPFVNDGEPGSGSIDYSYALGYSYSDDPNLMYCAEDMTTEGSVNWWLASCDLSGGSSGGPWVQPMDTNTGSGPVISVNSWGYATSSGMAGPMLHNTGAECVFTMARSTAFNSISGNDGEQGIWVDCQ